MEDNDCLCGHGRFRHSVSYTGPCLVQRMNEKGFYGMCSCNLFRLDNLKYLEQIYESKTSS